MKAVIKFTLVATGIVLIVIAATVILLGTHLESLARSHLEERLAFLFDARVELEGIRAAPLQGGIELEGLTVYNPASFKDSPAISAKRILVRPDLRTIFAPTLTLDEVLFEDTGVELRYKLGSGTNLGQLAQNAAKAMREKPVKRMFLVRELNAAGGKMNLRSNLTPPLPVALDIAPFTVQGLRKDEPVSAAKLAAVFLRSLVLETVTLKGLLRPAADALRKEIMSLQDPA